MWYSWSKQQQFSSSTTNFLLFDHRKPGSAFDNYADFAVRVTLWMGSWGSLGHGRAPHPNRTGFAQRLAGFSHVQQPREIVKLIYLDFVGCHGFRLVTSLF